ncbi:MAG: SPOR domain-containing protein [Acidobacteria bacterium]|nr:SPOR domain-containing protein [Acidobacteriota bacterium]
MKYAKVKQGQVPPVCLALMVLVFWLLPCSAKAMAGEYAVQIAAVRSQACAENLRGGLYARGLEAYWVRIVLPQHGVFYRVRLGRFPSIETAYSYAESLLDTGLLESYAITTYEMPNSVPLRDTTQASLEVQEYIQQPPTPRDTKDLLAAIGSHQWWLPTNTRGLFLTAPQLPPINLGMTPREILVYALSRKEWRLSYDNSVLFVRAPVIASSTPAVVNLPIREFAATAAPGPAPSLSRFITIDSNLLVTAPGPSPEIVSAAPVAVSKPVERSFAPANAPLTPPPSPGMSSASVPAAKPANSVLPPVTNANVLATNTGLNAARNSSDIRRGSTPTASKGVGYGRVAPPRLQASAEMRNGQLVMRIRNLDGNRPFTGTARVTLSDDRKSRDLAPMQFDVKPEDEFVVPLNESVTPGDDWMLMVYDENGALRLLRGQTIGQKPGASAQQAQNNAQPNQPELNPPPYVTPVYDATTTPGQIPAVGTVPTPQNSNLSGSLENNSAPHSGSASDGTVDPNAPTQLTVTPKLIAVTTDNVTMEFEIASPQPLQYISVTLAAGEHRDTRQALMSTTRGRVPFLVPAAQAQGAFLFEIKDENGRTLAGGAGDFRQMVGR